MIYIDKKQQPRKFANYTNKPGSHFDDMPSDVKQELRQALVDEQGSLCAYCMRRVTADSDHVKIEHWSPRNADNELKYTNLLAVCTGGEGDPYKRQICDTHKKDQPIRISPLNREDMRTIYYTSNGIICSTDPSFQHDIDEVLNLNDPQGYLIRNRKVTLQQFKDLLHQKLNDKTATKEVLQKYLTHYEQGNPQKVPFCGIIIWYLRKRLSQMKN